MKSVAILKQKDSIHSRTNQVASHFLAKGFPYVKVELEAEVQPDNYRNESECSRCSGSGVIECWNCGGTGTIISACSACSGRGIIENSDGKTECCSDCDNGRRENRCPECSDGRLDCGECDGRGYYNDGCWHESYHDAFWEEFKGRLGGTYRLFEYIKIYYDGSVDTEVTFTLSIENLVELPKIVSVFAETCRKFGSCNTGNAGLHIALLPEARYPCKKKLPEAKLANFCKQASKLLLGLAYLGSPNGSTRSFEYRDIEISSETKYSAIYTHKNTCIEYRLFDACFDRPAYILKYLELMSRTLHYYSDRPKRYLKLKGGISRKRSNKILNKSHRGNYRGLVDVFRTDESIARLFRELAYLVERKLKFWLGCIYRLYCLGTISKQQLFSNLVEVLKV